MCALRHATVMGATNIAAVVTRILSRAPEWIRKDLAARDALTRERAEEALAALISAALAEGAAKCRLHDNVPMDQNVRNG